MRRRIVYRHVNDNDATARIWCRVGVVSKKLTLRNFSEPSVFIFAVLLVSVHLFYIIANSLISTARPSTPCLLLLTSRLAYKTVSNGSTLMEKVHRIIKVALTPSGKINSGKHFRKLQIPYAYRVLDSRPTLLTSSLDCTCIMSLYMKCPTNRHLSTQH